MIYDNYVLGTDGKQQTLLVGESSVANRTSVNSGGNLIVFCSGVVRWPTVNYSGNIYISDDGIANSATIGNYGRISVSSGGTANDTVVSGGGEVCVYTGGSANYTTINSNGSMLIHSGGTATHTTARYGNIFVSAYGVADYNTLLSGRLYISPFGSANSTTVRYGTVYVSKNGAASHTTANAMGLVCVYSGGTANDATMNSLGCMYVYSGATASGVTVHSGGYMYISSGGNAYDVTVSPKGMLGGFGWNTDHHFDVIRNGSALVADNIIVIYNSMYVYSGGTASHTTVSGGNYPFQSAVLYVNNGGVAEHTAVNSGGSMYISTGGSAKYTEVNSDGKLKILYDGTATDTAVYNGTMYVAYAGTADNTTMTGGFLYVENGGETNNTYVGGGYLHVSQGGAANSTTVTDGTVYVCNGGVMNNTSIGSGGLICISSGGRHTGELSINGATVSAYKGSVVDFDISSVAPESTTARINNLSLIKGDPGYTITVSMTQANGYYVLAGGAAGFDKQITICMDNASEVSKTIRIGEGTGFGECTYSLVNYGDKLLLNVSGRVVIPSPAPKVTASITAPTNQNVYVKAVFSGDSAKKQYSLDNENWKNYTASIRFASNGTVYFREIDVSGNISEVATYKVTNIDKTAPTKPTVKVSTTDPTNKSVTVTATFSKDSAKKQYSTDKKKWSTYSKALTATKNGTYYFRAIDAVGNVSAVTSYKITNIDKTAPKAPTVKLSTTQATNQNVTVTATFSKDSAKKQYSTDNKTWKTYSKALSVGKNGTYYFRGVDAAGNVSEAASIKVANIDKTAPAAPTVKVSTTKVTNKSITVTATFSKDSTKKQYSTDNKTWKTYSKALSVGKNGTYYFRGIDAAGNVSKVKSVKIANYADTANNNWSGATVLKKTVLAVLEAKTDKVDYYNVSDVARLMLDMEKGKAKVSFYDANKKAVKVSAVTMANGSVRKNVSALTLTTNNAATDKFTIAALDDAVKYLKIETADKTLDSYKLAKLA